MSEPGGDLILPDGQLVPYNDPSACAIALDDLRQLKNRINDLIRELTDRLEAESQMQGRPTMHLTDGVTVVLSGRKQTLWDAQQLENDLRAAGMAEERIREIVKEEVSYKVNATEAKRAAVANEDYRKAVEGARTELDARPTVKVERAT